MPNIRDESAIYHESLIGVKSPRGIPIVLSMQLQYDVSNLNKLDSKLVRHARIQRGGGRRWSRPPPP